MNSQKSADRKLALIPGPVGHSIQLRPQEQAPVRAQVGRTELEVLA
jgi:hypothetical protein